MSAPDRPTHRPQRATTGSPAPLTEPVTSTEPVEPAKESGHGFDFSIEPPARPSRRPTRQPVTAISNSADSAESSESTPSVEARSTIRGRFSPETRSPAAEPTANSAEAAESDEPDTENVAKRALNSVASSVKSIFTPSDSKADSQDHDDSPHTKSAETAEPDSHTKATETAETAEPEIAAPTKPERLPLPHTSSFASTNSASSTVSKTPSELRGFRSTLEEGVTQETVPLPVLDQLPQKTVDALPEKVEPEVDKADPSRQEKIQQSLDDDEQATVSRQRKDSGINSVLSSETTADNGLGESTSIEENLLHHNEDKIQRNLKDDKEATVSREKKDERNLKDDKEATVSREKKDAGINTVLSSDTTAEKSLGEDPSIEEKLLHQNEDKIQNALHDDKEATVLREKKDAGINSVLDTEASADSGLGESTSIEEKLLHQNEDKIQNSLHDDKEATVSREKKDAGINSVLDTEASADSGLGESTSIEEKLLHQNEDKIQNSLHDDKEATVSREKKDAGINDVLSTDTTAEKSLGEDPSIEEKLVQQNEEAVQKSLQDTPVRPSTRPVRSARSSEPPELDAKSSDTKTTSVSSVEDAKPRGSVSSAEDAKPRGSVSSVEDAKPRGSVYSNEDKRASVSSSDGKPAKPKPSKADLIAARIARARAEAAQKPEAANLGGPRPLGPKPVFNKAAGSRVDTSKFDSLNAALSRGPPGRRSSSKSVDSEGAELAAGSAGLAAATEEPAAEPIESLPSQSRARPRGPKRRLPTQAKASWSTVTAEIWSVAPAPESRKSAQTEGTKDKKASFALGPQSDEAVESVEESVEDSAEDAGAAPAPGITRAFSETRANNAFNQALSPKSAPLEDPANAIEAAPFRLPGQQLDREPSPAEDQPGLPQIASLIDREVGVPSGMDHLGVNPDHLQGMQEQISAHGDDLTLPSLGHLVDRPVTPTYSRPQSPVERGSVTATQTVHTTFTEEAPVFDARTRGLAADDSTSGDASSLASADPSGPGNSQASLPPRPATRPTRPAPASVAASESAPATEPVNKTAPTSEPVSESVPETTETGLDPELQQRVTAAKEKIRLARERKAEAP